MAQTATLGESSATATWSLLLVGRERIDAAQRRVRLVGDQLDGFVHAGDTAVALTMRFAGAWLRRVGRIEAFDPEELRLDVTLPMSGDLLAHSWVEASEIGDPVCVELLST